MTFVKSALIAIFVYAFAGLLGFYLAWFQALPWIFECDVRCSPECEKYKW